MGCLVLLILRNLLLFSDPTLDNFLDIFEEDRYFYCWSAWEYYLLLDLSYCAFFDLVLDCLQLRGP